MKNLMFMSLRQSWYCRSFFRPLFCFLQPHRQTCKKYDFFLSLELLDIRIFKNHQSILFNNEILIQNRLLFDTVGLNKPSFIHKDDEFFGFSNLS
jgi:hypothetical protein